MDIYYTRDILIVKEIADNIRVFSINQCQCDKNRTSIENCAVSTGRNFHMKVSIGCFKGYRSDRFLESLIGLGSVVTNFLGNIVRFVPLALLIRHKLKVGQQLFVFDQI